MIQSKAAALWGRLRGFRGRLPQTIDQERVLAEAADFFCLHPDDVLAGFDGYSMLHDSKGYAATLGETKTLGFEEAFLLYLAASRVRPANVVEIGSQYGKSTRRILDLLEALGLKAHVTCFDIADELRYVDHDEVTLGAQGCDERSHSKRAAGSFTRVDLSGRPSLRPAAQRDCRVPGVVTRQRGDPGRPRLQPALYNPHMRIAKDDVAAIGTANGHWERYVLAEVFAYDACCRGRHPHRNPPAARFFHAPWPGLDRAAHAVGPRHARPMSLARYLAEWRDRARLLHKPDALSRIRLQPGDVAVDCGANVGLVTRRLARPGVTVYAFEPNPYAFAELQARFRGRPDVHCLNQGVLDTNGTLKLYLHHLSAQAPVKWSTGSSFLATKGNVDPNHAVEVKVIDLADFIFSLNRRVAVLKLDVEGVEYRILNRLLDTGALDQIDHVLVEAHERRMPALAAEAAQVRQRLAEAGVTHVDWSWI